MRPISRHSNPRKQGDAGLGLAIGWYASSGYTVCVPLTDSQDYDLVVDAGDGLQRVQVRTSTGLERPDVYRVNLRVNGGNRSGTGKRKLFDPTIVEALFVVCADGSMYNIPSSAIEATTTLCLGRKYLEYRVT